MVSQEFFMFLTIMAGFKMTAVQKFCSLEAANIDGFPAGAAVLPASFLPEQDVSPRLRIETVAAGPVTLSGQSLRALAKLQGRSGEAPAMRDLKGDQAELEKVASAELVIVCGNEKSRMQRAVEHMRAARLTFPIVAFAEGLDRVERVELLQAGFDDIFDDGMTVGEIVARAKALHERSRIYAERIAHNLPLRRNGKVGEAARDVFSGRERTILTVLQENQGRIVTYQEILARIGKMATARAVHTLQVTMSGLRQKLTEEWKILGINRTGYILVMSDVTQADMPEQVFG